MVRQGLDNFARVKICSIQGRQSQIGTRNLCQCGYMFFQECQVKIGTRSFRQEEDSLPLGPVNSNRDQISYLGMRSLFYQAGRDRQGLDLFARFEISSLQGHQGQMGINLFDVFQEFYSSFIYSPALITLGAERCRTASYGHGVERRGAWGGGLA